MQQIDLFYIFVCLTSITIYGFYRLLIDEEKAGFTRDELIKHLDNAHIESRPLWKPLHLQPVFKNAPHYVNGCAESLFDKGLCIPSGPMVSDDDLTRITSEITSLASK